MTKLTLRLSSVVPRRTLGQAGLFPIIAYCAGINLILVQWILVRELTALLLGTELVVLLVSVAYFAGLSVGYQLSSHIKREWLPPLALVTLLLHLTLPIWFRLLVSSVSAGGAYGLAFIVLPLLTPFIVSSFYSIFLPLIVDTGKGDLPTIYGIELLGSATGIVALVLFGGTSLQAIYALYTIGIMGILLALSAHLRWVVIAGLFGAAWILAAPTFNFWSNTLWYRQVAKLPADTVTLFSGYSAYQKVDVLETPSGNRYLFLDGLEHFGAVDGSRLNVVMGQIPASLTQPDNALVVGAGSMEMAAMIADHAGLVTTVEIDPMVVEASQRYFDSVNRLSTLTNRRILIDDAKHFIANSSERYDLVALDIPAAYSLQTATLYSVPFYQAIAEHLNDNGMLVANLTSTFAPDNLVSRRIVASLLTQFEQVMVYTPASAGWSFALAAQDLPLDQEMLASALRTNGEEQYVIFETPAVQAIVGDAPPITLDSMDIVLQTSVQWIAERWQDS